MKISKTFFGIYKINYAPTLTLATGLHLARIKGDMNIYTAQKKQIDKLLN